MMEYRIGCADGTTGRLARIAVEAGKITRATPSFEWAVGEGIHVVLSHLARQRIRWWPAREQPESAQMELDL